MPDEIPKPEYSGPTISFDDFRNFVAVKCAKYGIDESALLYMAVSAINRMHDAADRWVALEVQDQPSSAFWLTELEGRKISGALRSVKGSECRLFRRELRQVFDLQQP
jgi:hypothetical protein